MYLWSNGDPLTYANWLAGEPNNEDDEDYVLMNWIVAGAWDDGHNDAPPLRGIIEFVPEPASVPLGYALVGLLLLRARRALRALIRRVNSAMSRAEASARGGAQACRSRPSKAPPTTPFTTISTA